MFHVWHIKILPEHSLFHDVLWSYESFVFMSYTVMYIREMACLTAASSMSASRNVTPALTSFETPPNNVIWNAAKQEIYVRPIPLIRVNNSNGRRIISWFSCREITGYAHMRHFNILLDGIGIPTFMYTFLTHFWFIGKNGARRETKRRTGNNVCMQEDLHVPPLPFFIVCLLLRFRRPLHSISRHWHVTLNWT